MNTPFYCSRTGITQYNNRYGSALYATRGSAQVVKQFGLILTVISYSLDNL